MQIDDTMIVTTGGELTIPEDATPQQASDSMGQLVRVATQQAAALVLKDRPFYKSVALSATPLIYEHAGKRMVMVTTIVALMPDPTKAMGRPNVFPFGPPRGSTN